MRARIEFPAGMAGLDGTRACVLERFAEDALCVTLESEADPDACLLLGDVSRVAPGALIEPGAGDVRQLGGWQDGECGIFCRLGIPGGDPSAAGFDTDRLVLVNFRTGRGMEMERRVRGMIPFAVSDALPPGQTCS